MKLQQFYFPYNYKSPSYKQKLKQETLIFTQQIKKTKIM